MCLRCIKEMNGLSTLSSVQYPAKTPKNGIFSPLWVALGKLPFLKQNLWHNALFCSQILNFINVEKCVKENWISNSLKCSESFSRYHHNCEGGSSLYILPFQTPTSCYAHRSH